MIFYDYFLPYSLAKEMDEKRATAAALGYPVQLIVNKDDDQHSGDGASAVSLKSSGILPQQQTSAGGQWQQNTSENNEGQYDFVPHFQRVSIGGEDNSGVIIYFILIYIYIFR